MNRQLPLGLQLQASARFSNFLAGPNQEPVDQLKQTAAGTGDPFFLLWGAPGSGKSHLLQAACHLAADRGRTVAYVSLAEPDGLPPELLEDWEGYQLVCIDDVHCVAGNRRWEEALFNLYNRIRERYGSLIVSSVSMPAGHTFRLPDLASRLGWGLVYQLHPLDDEQRLAALQQRASLRGCEMPDETGRYLLRRLPRDMPALFELLDRLDEASLAAQRKLTVPFVKSVLGL
ncbi:MAG: DnaA regulatory inactivator Hda [Thiogranum sp.]